MSRPVVSAVAHRTGSQKVGMGPLTRQKSNTIFAYTELRREKEKERKEKGREERKKEGRKFGLAMEVG